MKSNAVKIYGNDKEILSVTLVDVLKCITDGNDCKWSILWLEAIGNPGSKSMLDLEKEIRSSEKGLLIEWQDLFELSKSFDQVIEIILIGDKDISNLKRYDSEDEMYLKCEYTIELVDSSYWIMHAKNSASLELIKNNLLGVKEF